MIHLTSIRWTAGEILAEASRGPVPLERRAQAEWLEELNAALEEHDLIAWIEVAHGPLLTLHVRPLLTLHVRSTLDTGRAVR